MWKRCSHILAPITKLSGKHQFTWGQEQQPAFKQIKDIMSQGVLLKYPNHNLPFDIDTDASNYQLDTVIKQNRSPVAYFSQKLSPTKIKYTMTEKELLSIKETLKTFCTMLLGARLNIYTDHHNITCHNLITPCVLWWCLYLEEYAPTFYYKRGVDNVCANVLSRPPLSHRRRRVCLCHYCQRALRVWHFPHYMMIVHFAIQSYTYLISSNICFPSA